MNSKLLEFVAYVRNECPSQLSALAKQDPDIVREHKNLVLADGFATLATYVEDIGWVDLLVELDANEDGLYTIEVNAEGRLQSSLVMDEATLMDYTLEEIYHDLLLSKLFA